MAKKTREADLTHEPEDENLDFLSQAMKRTVIPNIEQKAGEKVSTAKDEQSSGEEKSSKKDSSKSGEIAATPAAEGKRKKKKESAKAGQESGSTKTTFADEFTGLERLHQEYLFLASRDEMKSRTTTTIPTIIFEEVDEIAKFKKMPRIHVLGAIVSLYLKQHKNEVMKAKLENRRMRPDTFFELSGGEQG